MLAAIGGFEEAAAGAAGAERPALAAEVPHARHRSSSGACGFIASMPQPVDALAPAEHFAPGLAAVGGLVDAALVVVVPEVAGGAGVDGVAVLGIDQDLGDVFGILQADVGPVLAAVGRFVDAVADGDAVARPSFSPVPTQTFFGI